MTALFVVYDQAGISRPNGTAIDWPGPVTSMADVEKIAEIVHKQEGGGWVRVLGWRRFDDPDEQTGGRS